MFRGWLKTLLGIFFWCLLLTAPSAAQDSSHAVKGDEPLPTTVNEPTDDVQWWPDMQLTWRLKPAFSLVLFGTIRRGQHNDAAITKQLGVGFNWALHRNFTLASQYRHVITTLTPTRRAEEERFHVDLIPRTNLRAGLVLSDRNRIEVRQINGVFSMRYRNRSQIERPFDFTINGQEQCITPYLSLEVFYDTRVHAWPRKQLYVGSRLPLAKHVTFNGFYMRQFDWQARPGYIHILASFLQFDF